MITDAILNGVRSLVEVLLGLLPSWSPPDWGSMGTITDIVLFANAFVPLSELMDILQVLAAGAGIWVTAWFTIRLIDWLPFT